MGVGAAEGIFGINIAGSLIGAGVGALPPLGLPLASPATCPASGARATAAAGAGSAAGTRTEPIGANTGALGVAGAGGGATFAGVEGIYPGGGGAMYPGGGGAIAAAGLELSSCRTRLVTNSE